MTPRRHRKDANSDDIQDAAEPCGWLWQDTSQTDLGYDAILVKGGRSVYVEVKDGSKPPSEQRLTPHEEQVHAQLSRYGVTVELLTCIGDLQVLERPQQARRDG